MPVRALQGAYQGSGVDQPWERTARDAERVRPLLLSSFPSSLTTAHSYSWRCPTESQSLPFEVVRRLGGVAQIPIWRCWANRGAVQRVWPRRSSATLLRRSCFLLQCSLQELQKLKIHHAKSDLLETLILGLRFRV